jgi:N-methylhydantoinase A
MECVNVRVRAAVAVEAARFPEWPGSGPVTPSGEQRAYFAEIGETTLPVYRRGEVPAEHPLKGPALVEDPWATTLIYPGQTGLLDRFGNLTIEVAR